MTRTTLGRTLVELARLARWSVRARATPREVVERERERIEMRARELRGGERQASEPQASDWRGDDLHVRGQRIAVDGRAHARAAIARRFDRRTFVGAGVALAASTAFSGCSGLATRRRARRERVVVVGAGLAGLHCAYRLRALGIEADVFDAAARVGGRVHSDRTTFAAQGQTCELGGELVDTPHVTMHALAAELGLEFLDFQTDDPALDRLVVHVGGRRVPAEELVAGLQPLARAIDVANASFGDSEAPIAWNAPRGAGPADRASLRAWLDGARVEGPARALIDVAYTTEYGLEPDDSSALNLLQMIAIEERRFELFGASDERFRFADGNDAVVRELAARLDAGRVHLGQRLVRVRELPDRSYACAFERDGATREIVADHVVLALPFTLLREVALVAPLSPVKRRAIDELGYGTNAKLMVGFEARPWRAAASDGSVVSDLPFQCAWETSRLQPGAAGLMTNFTGGARGRALGAGSVESAARAFASDLDRVYSGAARTANGRAVRAHWPTHPLTRGSYASYRVGQWTAFGGIEGERSGNLHFCGEHTSRTAQGFMEGAAATGCVAADEIAGDLGLDLAAVSASSEQRAVVEAARCELREPARAGA